VGDVDLAVPATTAAKCDEDGLASNHGSQTMDSWKKLICRGNRSFECGRLDEAARQYLAALQEADHCIGCVAQECAAAEACGGIDPGSRFETPASGSAATPDSQPGAAAGSHCRYLDAVAAVAAYVVTQLNLADLCLRLDRTDEATDHLQAMQARLRAIIDDTGQPWTLRAAALRNSRRAQDAVLSFVEEHGIAGPSCAFERSITHLPPSAVLH
jgi:hypothetical protein